MKNMINVAKDVLEGKWGNGAERKERLESAGYNYTEVQKIVNKIYVGTAVLDKYESFDKAPSTLVNRVVTETDENSIKKAVESISNFLTNS